MSAPSITSVPPLGNLNELQGNCMPTKVVIQLATQVVIPDFESTYESIPIENFQPSYLSLQDGTLLAPPYISDLSRAFLSLVILSISLFVFLCNIAVTGHYFFVRSKIIQDRRLFLALFISQVISPAGFLPTMLSYFGQHAINCTIALQVERIVSFLSLSLLVPVILGFKAYKVLGDSRMVAAANLVLLLGATVVMVFEVKDMRCERRLSGSCIPTTPKTFMVISVVLQLAQIVVIFLSFLYAILQARRVRLGRLWSMLTGGLHDNHYTSRPSRRRPRSSGSSFGPTFAASSPSSPALPSPRHPISASPSPPSITSLSHLLPSLFYKVLKDELLFTALIASLCLLAVVLTLIGLKYNENLSVQGWFSVLWVCISVAVMKTFDKALVRHEQSIAVAAPTTGRSLDPPTFSPAIRIPTDDDFYNPFSDQRRLLQDRLSVPTLSSVLTKEMDLVDTSPPVTPARDGRF